MRRIWIVCIVVALPLAIVASGTGSTASAAVTSGNWTGTYGSAGYVLAGWNRASDLVSLPGGIGETLQQGGRYTWAASTTDPRALQSPDGSSRTMSTYWDFSAIKVQLRFPAAYSGNLHLYALDPDTLGRRESITVDDGSGPRTVHITTDMSQGVWVTLPISPAAGGTVSITVTRDAGVNAVLSGIMLGDSGSDPPSPPSAGPVNTTAPKVSGVPSMVTADNNFNCASSCVGASPSVTGSVSVSNGTWTGSPTFAYQWQDCDDSGTNCTNATGSGSTSATYTLDSNDLNHTIKAVVTATNGSGSASASGYTGPGAAQFNRYAWAGIGTTGPNPALTTAQEAERYQYLTLEWSDQTTVNTLKADNPNLLLTPYLDPAAPWVGGGNNQSSCTWGPTDLTSAGNNLGNQADDWLVRNSSSLSTSLSNISGYGAGSASSGTPGLADVGNAAYQNSCYADALGLYTGGASGSDYQGFTTTGWNGGAYWDNVNDPRYTFNQGADGYIANGTGSAVDRYASTGTGEAAYVTAMESFIANAKAYFAAHGGPKLMVPNIFDVASASSPSATNVNPFFKNIIDNTGGVFTQTWLTGGGGPSGQSGTSDLGVMSDELYAEAHDDYYQANTAAGASPSEALSTFEEATLMLGANGHSSLGTDGNSSGEAWFPEFNMARELGPATGAVQTRSSSGATYYERDFANGVVLSNPTQTAVTTPLAPTPGGSYWGVTCSADSDSCSEVSNASTVTLGTDGGAVLLNHS